jgi:hypothetical protein
LHLGHARISFVAEYLQLDQAQNDDEGPHSECKPKISEPFY